MDFKTFNSVVDVIADARFPIMIRGKHGMGKSETVYQFAKRRNMPVIERRLSQMTEGDLLGLPSVDGNRTSWNPPDWYKDACDKPVVLFLDELDRAITEVKQGVMQLTDSRTLNGYRLHPETLVFAACNGGVHGAQYTVNDLDPAELDRWTVFDLEPSVEDFLEYANGKVAPVLWDFLNQNRSHLEHKGEFEPNKVYPTRRSWFRANDALVRANLLDGDKLKQVSQRAYLVAQGFVGFEAAISLKDFMDKYERQVTVEDILEGKLSKTKGFKLNDHISLVEKMIGAKILSDKLTPEQMQNVAKFYFNLPAEAAMKFYTEINSDKNLLSFVIAFHKVQVDGRTIKDYIISVMKAAAPKK